MNEAEEAGKGANKDRMFTFQWGHLDERSGGWAHVIVEEVCE